MPILTKKEKIEFQKIDFAKNIPQQILDILFEKEIQSLIIEGGSYTLQSFIAVNLWDEARVFIGSGIFQNGTKAPVITKQSEEKITLLNDELLIFRNYD